MNNFCGCGRSEKRVYFRQTWRILLKLCMHVKTNIFHEARAPNYLNVLFMCAISRIVFETGNKVEGMNHTNFLWRFRF